MTTSERRNRLPTDSMSPEGDPPDRATDRANGRHRTKSAACKTAIVDGALHERITTAEPIRSVSSTTTAQTRRGSIAQTLVQDCRVIRRSQLRTIVPLSDTTIYEMEQRGEFPRRFYLTPRCAAWSLSEVEVWVAQRRQSVPTNTAPAHPVPDVRLRRARPVKAPKVR